MLKNKFRLGRGINLFAPKVFQTPLFTFRVAKNDLVYNRYGFIVSKKIDKRATLRNALKRRMRSCVENIFDKIKTGFDMVIILKKNALSKKQEDLCADISLFLKSKHFLI